MTCERPLLGSSNETNVIGAIMRIVRFVFDGLRFEGRCRNPVDIEQLYWSVNLEKDTWKEEHLSKIWNLYCGFYQLSWEKGIGINLLNFYLQDPLQCLPPPLWPPPPPCLAMALKVSPVEAKVRRYCEEVIRKKPSENNQVLWANEKS